MRRHLPILVLACLVAALAPIMAQAQWSRSGSTTSLTNSGDTVGVGTTSPDAKLHLFQPSGWGLAVGSALATGIQLRFSGNAMGAYYLGNPSSYVINPDGGSVGVGTPNPDTKFHVYGGGGYLFTVGSQNNAGPNLRASSNALGAYNANAVATLYINPDGGATQFGGSVNVTGNIAAKYQDIAEWVDASEPMEAGTVVILDPEKSNRVMPSNQAYDTRVAGVVSDQPGVILGEASSSKEKIATTGRVKVRVDAGKAGIRIGDLLVASDKSGVAMKSQPVKVAGTSMHRPGTIIGKALEPLTAGQGEILVLLTLQ